jgi:hypothetical protein
LAASIRRRRQRTGSELLDGVEPGNHAPGRLDLQRRRTLNQVLASPRTNVQAMLQVTLIPGECHGGGVCSDMQRMQYLGLGSGWADVAVRRLGFGSGRLFLKEAPRLHEV